VVLEVHEDSVEMVNLEGAAHALRDLAGRAIEDEVAERDSIRKCRARCALVEWSSPLVALSLFALANPL
jgi:hypothetical protein